MTSRFSYSIQTLYIRLSTPIHQQQSFIHSALTNKISILSIFTMWASSTSLHNPLYFFTLSSATTKKPLFQHLRTKEEKKRKEEFEQMWVEIKSTCSIELLSFFCFVLLQLLRPRAHSPPRRWVLWFLHPSALIPLPSL